MPFFGSLGILITRVLVVAAVVVYLFSEISTLVGSGLPGYFDGSIQFNQPTGVVFDSAGTMYVADSNNHRIRKITRDGVVSTFAGSGSQSFADGTGTNARFNAPWGLAFDSAGILYVAEAGNHRIRKITPEGVVSTFAGSGTNTFADGTGTSASFNQPFGIAVDSAGTVYVADTTNQRIRKITPLGVVSTFAGDGNAALLDGSGTNTRFNTPRAIAVDSAGNVYVADYANHCIRKITPGGLVSRFAGGDQGYLDGTGTNARFVLPWGVAVDSAGIVYVTEVGHRIRRITTLGVVTTIAGRSQGFSNGIGTNADFNNPIGITLDSVGNIYVGEGDNHRIRKITPAGLATTFAGSGVAGFSDSIRPYLFSNAQGIVLDSTGNVYVGDTYNHRIRKITPGGVVTTLAGSIQGYTDGVGTNARFNNPWGLAIDSAGNIIVADKNNYRIRRITPAGVVTTIAGNDTPQAIDATGTNASFREPTGLVFDSAGNLYIADNEGNRIRRMTPDGVVSTFSTGYIFPNSIAIDSNGTLYVADYGNSRVVTTGGSVIMSSQQGPYGITVDSLNNIYVSLLDLGAIRKRTPGGVITIFASGFIAPAGLTVDSSNNVYVADRGDGIYKITPEGVKTTFAGGGGQFGYSDGGYFSAPVGVTTDWDGTMYVADNNCIRKITSRGVVTTLAGDSTTSGAINGVGTTATFNFPRGTAVNSARTVYVTDSINRLIRAVSSTGSVSTLAGSGAQGFADGTGGSATFNTPVGITVDRLDTVYVSDIGNHNIRRITSGGVVTTLAGSRTATFADGVGTNASFNTPSGIVADIYGNVYVADTNNHRVRRIASDGTVTTLAGQATPGYVDGTGSSAQFNFPYHLSIDSVGILYVADQTNNRIRRIQPSTGVVTTLAGDGTAGFMFSRFSTPQGVTVDRFRQAYVADTGNHSIRKIADVYTLPENNGVATTIAGDGTAGFLDGNGIAARVNLPRGVGVDSVGNVYVGDLANNRIRKITPAGVVTVLAGGTVGFLDGTGTNARFSGPWGVAADSEGNVYVGDQVNHRIRKISPAGVVTTLAGSGSQTFGNGTGATASFNAPHAIALDRDGNVYVADNGNFRIRKVTPGGVVTTLAGNAGSAVTDGVGTSAQFNTPQGIAVDSEGVVYVADYGGHRIRRISTLGVVTTIAGSTQGSANGTGTSAQFNFPRGITVDSAGNVYVADESNHRIRKITPAGVVTTLAGTTQGFANGTGTNARFNFPVGMSVDSVGNVYVGDRTNSRIRKIGTAVAEPPLNRGVVTTFAGSTVGFLNATGTNALFNSPFGVAVNSVGTIFVADRGNSRIRSITPSGVVSTFAGTGSFGSTDGAATGANFNGPTALDIDVDGNLYVVDFDNQRIRKISPAGVVSTLAGSVQGFQDGSGTSARFNNPNGIATDLDGNVYVTDGNQLIRKITPGGLVSTFAGRFGFSGSADGVGTNATFTQPRGVGVDSAGNLYVGDSGNHRIRKITPAGVVSTFAGSGIQGLTDGVASSASFSVPSAIRLDSTGNIYVLQNLAVRRITPQGVVTTVAGREATGGPLDGTGTNALFNAPGGIAVDSRGTIFVGDTNGFRVRRII